MVERNQAETIDPILAGMRVMPPPRVAMLNTCMLLNVGRSISEKMSPWPFTRFAAISLWPLVPGSAPTIGPMKMWSYGSSNTLSPCQTTMMWNGSFFRILRGNRGLLISPQTNRSCCQTGREKTDAKTSMALRKAIGKESIAILSGEEYLGYHC
jgi:hypothetical protein